MFVPFGSIFKVQVCAMDKHHFTSLIGFFPENVAKPNSGDMLLSGSLPKGNAFVWTLPTI